DGDRIAAAGDGGAGGHVVGDPDPPGVAVGQVGDGADPLHIADADQEKADQHQGEKDKKGSGKDLAFVFLKFIVTHYLSLPSWCLSVLSWLPCRFMFFTAMKQRVL